MSTAENEEEKDGGSSREPFRWWQVTREACVAGTLEKFVTKGKARRNASRSVALDWVFQPSLEIAATVSPTFGWLQDDMQWNVRFQRSPFESDILHELSWSIFLDLQPPFHNTSVYRVSGFVHLGVTAPNNNDKDETKWEELWKFEHDLEPASMYQEEVCTWCQRRLDLNDLVQTHLKEKRSLTLRVRLASWGLGREPTVSPDMKVQLERLPFTFTVGATTLARRCGWDLRKHLQSFSQQQVDFWKSLWNADEPTKKMARKLSFGPRDLVAVIGHDHTHGITSWHMCNELRLFAMEAIHLAKYGVTMIPYHLMFYDFDLMDGTTAEEDTGNEPWQIELFAPEKHAIIHKILDWIAEKPLLAAFYKEANDPHNPDTKRQSSFSSTPIFSSVQEQERNQTTKDDPFVLCSCCNKEGQADDMPLCARCRSVYYCSRACQRRHWKQGHKKECERLEHERKTRKKAQKDLERRQEEAKAGDLALAGDKIWNDETATFTSLRRSGRFPALKNLGNGVHE